MEEFSTKPVQGSSLDSATRDKLASTGSPTVQEARSAEVSDIEPGFLTKNKWYILVLSLALLILGIMAYFAFSKPSKVDEPKVKVEIVVPDKVASGTEGIIKAVVFNGDSRTITKGELELVYPNGVQFSSSNPNAENLSGNLFAIPDLSPGANTTVFIKLKFLGGVGDNLKLSAKFSFALAGLSAQFDTRVEALTVLSTAGMTVDIDGPTTATNGQLVSYTIHYSNASTESFDRVRLELNMPVQFQFADSKPAPSQGQNVWDIGKLAPGNSGEVVVSGAYVSASQGSNVPWQVRLLVPDALGAYYAQSTGEFTTGIANLPLVVSESVSGGQREGVAKPGDNLQYKIDYQNNATVAARGVRIVMTVDSATVDLSTVQAEGASISGNTITWNAVSKPELEVLNPNESGSLSLSLKIRDVPVQDRSVNPTVVTSVKIKSDEYDAYLPGNKLEVKISTQFNMETVVSFLDGARPPKVGQATRYKVTINLKNTTNDISSSTLSMFIASGSSGFDINSVNAAESKAVSYDASTGKLTWRVETLKAHSGDFSPARNLEFVVRVVPALASVGLPITLVKNIQFSGTDTSTNQIINRTANPVTSTDSGNTQDGSVVK